jgi:type I restriction enzyme S subunit
MNEWKKCKLSEVSSKFAMGPFGSNIKAENFTNEGVPVIRGTNLNFDRFVGGDFVYLTEQKADELKSSNCYPGDLVFTHRGTIGQVGLIPNNMYSRYVISQSGMKVSVNPNMVDNRFLFYFFKSEIGQHELLQHESQVGVPSISNPLTSLKSVSLLLPPLPEQRAIASVLSSLDDKIDLLHRQNKTLESMAETLFRQWFVDENEISTIKLGDIIEIYDSKRIPLSSTERETMKDGHLYPYYGAATIMDHINDFIFDGEYLLLGEDGTVQTDAGLPILQLAVGKFWVNNHTHVLKAKEPFTNFLLYSILKKTSVSHIVTGAVQPKINQENLKNLEIDVPNNVDIKKTANDTNNFWDKIKLNNTQIRTLESLRDTLLPKLMSGEVRVQL